MKQIPNPIMKTHSRLLKALLLVGIIALLVAMTACQPEAIAVDPHPRQLVSNLSSPTPQTKSPLPTPTPSLIPTSQPTPAFSTMMPWSPPTPPAQTPTPLPLPPVPTSPAGNIFFTAFYPPGATPSEPKLFYAPFDEHGQPSGPIARWTPSVDTRVDIERLNASPNSKYLASTYETEVGEATQIIDLAAGKPVAFVSAGEFFGWHPNGYEFLFDQEVNLDLGLWLVDVSTGQHRLLAQPSAINVSGAAISPDGQVLAYGISGPGIQQIWLANADGSEPRLVLNGNSTAIVYNWSPDGHDLLFMGELRPVMGKGTPVPDLGGPLWLMDRDGQNRRPLNLPRPVMLSLKPVWSPTGRYVASVGQINEPPTCQIKKAIWPEPLCLLQDAGVYVEDVETGQVQLVARQAANPAWSPDGSLLAISRMDEKGQVDIWVIGIDGQNLQRVTNTAEFDRYPVWIPQ